MLELTRELIDSRHPHPVHVNVDRSTDVPDEQLRRDLQRYLHDSPMLERFWIFGYGSLLWKPEVPVARTLKATVLGFRRRFCLRQVRSRGRPDEPCLMLALDSGVSCVSLVQEVRGNNLLEAVWPVWRREMRGHGYVARWVTAYTIDGPVTALTFVANKAGHRYLANLSLKTTARMLAAACGPRGACADYLRETVLKLNELGIRDEYMWQLQQLVAEELRRRPAREARRAAD